MVMLGGRGNLEARRHGLGGVRDEKKQRCSQHSTLMREEDSGAHNTAGNNNRTLNPKDDDDDNLIFIYFFGSMYYFGCLEEDWQPSNLLCVVLPHPPLYSGTGL